MTGAIIASIKPRIILFLPGLLSVLAIGAPALAQERLATTTTSGALAPPEPWADPGLKVTRGLTLWLDAGRLNAARKAHGRPEAVRRHARRHLVRRLGPRPAPRPATRRGAAPISSSGAVRFDGEASFLERPGPKVTLEDFTLFIVAAPFSNAGGFRASWRCTRRARPTSRAA